jgi:nucleoside-diphosphate-sugar epimerase
MTVETKQMGRVALVLGATGGIGGHVARALLDRGWTVRGLSRKADEAASSEPRLDWIQGDAMNAGDVSVAAEGADVIVHAVNPPGYQDWQTLVLPMLDNTIAAARRVGARIVLPGTVYNYGPDAFPLLSEDSPQHPVTRKGAIRVEMERRLKAASEEGVRVLILRAGDFFGPKAGSSWFNQGMVTQGKTVTAVTRPNTHGTAHQWAYLPDVAETMMRLLERRAELPDFACFQMRGVWDADGNQMIEAVSRVAGRTLKVRAFPWWIVPIAAPFVRLFGELKEMRYLWRVPLRMGNEKLVAFLGEEPSTPLDTAIRATLADMQAL